jgi:hypothetical protein
MILLVTPSERASECAAALRDVTGLGVLTIESLARAAPLLRSESYLAVVLDQYLLETEPLETETLLDHLGAAILVQINLAISGKDRLVREVRAAIQRRRHDEIQAREAATSRLQSELNSTVTALLLASELGLETPNLSPAAIEKLHSVHELVKKLRRQLESAIPTENSGRAAGV